MSRPAQETKTGSEFEFAALAEAKNYRKAIFTEFEAVLGGEVIEIGAGIGQMTQLLTELPRVRRALAVEPNGGFCEQHRQRFPNHQVLQGTVGSVPDRTSCDAVLSINVLEHIENDEAELAAYAYLLRKRRGVLCLFVPARPEIYAPIDRDFGHFRRYTPGELQKKLTHSGFKTERLHYFNFLGYFAWWLDFCVLKKRAFAPKKIRAYDRIVIPVLHRFESKILRPPFGQSLVAIARAS